MTRAFFRHSGRWSAHHHHMPRAGGQAAAPWAAGPGRALRARAVARPRVSRLAGYPTVAPSRPALRGLAPLGQSTCGARRSGPRRIMKMKDRRIRWLRIGTSNALTKPGRGSQRRPKGLGPWVEGVPGGLQLIPCGTLLGRFRSLVAMRLSDLAVRPLPEVRRGLSDTVWNRQHCPFRQGVCMGDDDGLSTAGTSP